MTEYVRNLIGRFQQRGDFDRGLDLHFAVFMPAGLRGFVPMDRNGDLAVRQHMIGPVSPFPVRAIAQLARVYQFDADGLLIHPFQVAPGTLARVPGLPVERHHLHNAAITANDNMR